MLIGDYTLRMSKLIIGILLGIISVLVVVLLIHLTSADNQHEQRNNEDVLHLFNKAEIARLDEMVKRHNEKKGDYLILIPPIFDGGYWIHDVHSDGREVTWTMDNSRDGMSSEKEKIVFSCKTVSKQETDDNHEYLLSQCKGMANETVLALRISKNSLD